MTQPPGQRSFGTFPRFGIPFWEAPPKIIEPPVIRVEGAVARPMAMPVARLAELERRSVVTDFHCVTGWSALNLRWSGVAFRAFYDSIIVPEVRPAPGVSHIRFEGRGADGFSATLLLEDAFADDVMLADQLDGIALDSDHGAPVRLLSPRQYGYKSAKHLCRIELHTQEVPDGYSRGLRRRFLKWIVTPHPRARVLLEERHRHLPAWLVRGIYRVVLRPIWLWAFDRFRFSKRE